MKKNYTWLEGIGVIILVIVLAAAHDIPQAVWDTYQLIMYIMIAGVATTALTSFARMAGYTRYWILLVLGILLLSIGGGMFYFRPDFFATILAIPMGYWVKVTAYSLPAICVEGGLLTLFTLFHERHAWTSVRERNMVITGFSLYAVITVAINFLVIGGIVSVAHQIMFSRVIIAGTIAVTGAVLFRELRQYA